MQVLRTQHEIRDFKRKFLIAQNEPRHFTKPQSSIIEKVEIIFKIFNVIIFIILIIFRIRIIVEML